MLKPKIALMKWKFQCMVLKGTEKEYVNLKKQPNLHKEID